MNSTPTITVPHKWHWREYDSLCGGRTKGRTREGTDGRTKRVLKLGGSTMSCAQEGSDGRYDGMGGISDSLGLALLSPPRRSSPSRIQMVGLCCRL